MGILTEFIIAQKDDGPAIGECIRPATQWPTLEGWKGVDTIMVATLYCIVVSEAYTNALNSSFQLVGGNRGDGPWVFRMPEKVVNAIASIEPETIRGIAQHWVKTEEMVGWSSDMATVFISQLIAHTRKAAEMGRDMFLWVCL